MYIKLGVLSGGNARNDQGRRVPQQMGFNWLEDRLPIEGRVNPPPRSEEEIRTQMRRQMQLGGVPDEEIEQRITDVRARTVLERAAEIPVPEDDDNVMNLRRRIAP